MNSSLAASLQSRIVVLVLWIFAPPLPAWAQGGATASPQPSFIFFQRTSGHARYSTPEAFQHVVDDLLQYLKANRVALVIGGNSSPSGAEMPWFATQQMARDSKAAYLLYVIVDRPASKWLKVTVQCYDATGQQIWKEESTGGGERFSSLFTSGKATRNTLENLHEELNRRLGQPGLLTEASDHGLPVVPSAGDAPDVVRLASGTLVRLLVTDSVSSKTAQPGDAVKMQVLGDVRVDGLVVIANKAPASATIVDTRSAGRAWRAGTMAVKLQTVTLLNQQQQPLRAWSALKGVDTGAGMFWTNAVLQSYGFALLFLPLAPLQHGNQATLRRGTVLEAAINEDALLPRAVIEAAQPKPAEPRQGPASVTIYNSELGGLPSVEVWCGEVKMGHLRKGQRLTVTLPPGRYWLRPWKRGLATAFDAEMGGEQYVGLTVTPEQIGGLPNTTGRPHFSMVPHDVGEAQAADTTPAKSQDVQDVAKLDLAKLQADPHSRKK